jgi:non-specific serine/threonine protein kinase
MSPSEFRDQFDFVEELGRGGMGIVELYRQKSPARRVAIKRLKPEYLAEPEFRSRFYTEANAAGRLSHPNIVTIFQVVDLPDAEGGPRIVMERIEGGSLSALIDSGSLTPERAYRICAQVAGALAAAHAQGIIHRDLKPCNAMIAKGDLVKVVDFGLARDTGVDPNATTVAHPRQSTGPGHILGTPDYMSPEQRQAVRADARTDLWAFGCILYECLTGRVACGWGAGPDFSLLTGSVPAAVRHLIATCLEPDRERRTLDAAAIKGILDRVLTAAPEPDVPDPAQPAHPESNLPRDRTGFVGRSSEIAALRRLVGAHGLVTITGPGGCGKTRVALALARSCLKAAAAEHTPPARTLCFPDGVLFCDLAPARTPIDVVACIARAAQVREEPDKDLASTLVTALSARRLLLVLDNCEQVHEACATLAATILDACTGVRMIATSRRALEIAGEQAFPLDPLSLPRPESATPGEIASSDAVDLFVQRARLVRPGFAVTDDNSLAIAAICRRLDGLPLALEIAASWMRSMTPGDLKRRLDADLGSFVGGPGSAGSRALSGVFGSSYEGLAPGQQRMLRRLSVFRGGWSAEACLEVCGQDAAQDLGILVSHSLVVADLTGDAARYRMLEPIRALARELLRADAAEEAEARRLHLGCFAALGARLCDDLQRADPRALSFADAEYDNFRAALDFAEASDPHTGLALATSISRYWYITGRLSEGRGVLGRALNLTGAAAGSWSGGKGAAPPIQPPRIAPELLARAHNALGVLCVEARDLAEAEARFTASLEISRAIGDEANIAGRLSNLGIVAERRGRGKEAHAFHEQALDMYTRLGDARGAAMTRLNLGVILHVGGKLAQAEKLYRDCLPEFERAGDHFRAATAHRNLGEICFSRKDWRGAMRAFARAGRLGLDSLDWPGVAETVRWAGMAAAECRLSALAITSLLVAAGILEMHKITPAPDAGCPEPTEALLADCRRRSGLSETEIEAGVARALGSLPQFLRDIDLAASP